MANKLKMIRDNETGRDVAPYLETIGFESEHLETYSAGTTDLENVLSQDNALQTGDMSEVLNALSRYFCYLYDIEKDEDRKEILLGYLARIKLYLIMMEEVEHKGKKLSTKKLSNSNSTVWEER
jgi:hypothetical protein